MFLALTVGPFIHMTQRRPIHVLSNMFYRSWCRKITISEIFTGVLCTVGGTLVDRVIAILLRKISIICSFCSISLQRLQILKWYLVYRFNIRISRSSCVVQFLAEFWPLGFEKFQLLAVSNYFLCRDCTYWNEIWYVDSSPYNACPRGA
jgi:hypothetical protein